MVIVITGASSGIGKQTAQFLAEKGYLVYGISRSVVQDVNFKSIQCDITDHEAFNRVLTNIAEEVGIDVLINNAGMGIAGAIEYATDEEINRIFDLNVLALINACKTVTPLMRKRGGGKIINLCSVAGVIPIPFQTCYSVTKAAVDMFSMSFGLEVKDFNIQVTSILPGDTKTGFTKNRVKSEVLDDEFYGERIKASIERMEKDEQNGKDPQTVTNVIYKVIKKRKAPLRKTIGFTYKLIVFLERIVPRRFMLWIVKKLYG